MFLSSEQKLKLLKQWGNYTLAYSVVFQPELDYFGDESGFIAFKRWKNRILVLADPICAPDRLETLLHDFVNNYADISFWQISETVANVLHDMGFYLNEMGPDFHIPLQSYDFNGRSKRNLRASANRADRLGYTIKEFQLDDVDVTILQAISEQWRHTRIIKKREVVFLNRPIQFREEPDVRRFIALDAQQQPIAFVFCDPIYQNNNIVGYSTSFKRRKPGSDLRVEQAITKYMIELLGKQGYQYLYLGCAPLANMLDDQYRYNKITKRFFSLLYRSKWFNRYYYNLQGHYNYKLDYRAIQEKTYYASKRKLNTPHFIAFCFISHIVTLPAFAWKLG